MSRRKRIEQTSLFDHARLLLKAGAQDRLLELIGKYPELVYLRDIPDGRGIQTTLLHEASGKDTFQWPENMADIVDVLIDAGADVNATEMPEKGETPLHQAVSVNNVEVAEILLKRGANPERTGRYDGFVDTALGYALFHAIDERLPIFFKNSTELLLEFGARIYLPFAAALNDKDFVFNAFNSNGLLRPGMGKGTPELTIQHAFLFACRYGHLEIAAYLIERGARINEKIEFFGHLATGLHLACEQGDRADFVEMLLKKGANKKIKDGMYQSTPEGWAMFCGQEKVYQLLRKVG